MFNKNIKPKYILPFALIIILVGVGIYIRWNTTRADVGVAQLNNIHGYITDNNGRSIEGFVRVIVPGDQRRIRTTEKGAFVIEKIKTPNVAQISFQDVNGRVYAPESFEVQSYFLQSGTKLVLEGWKTVN